MPTPLKIGRVEETWRLKFLQNLFYILKIVFLTNYFVNVSRFVAKFRFDYELNLSKLDNFSSP